MQVAEGNTGLQDSPARPDGSPWAARLRTGPSPWLVLVLLGLALASFWPVGSCQFVEFDDPAYVTANRQVAAGLGAQGLRWAFTSVGYASNWHPLTWLAHMADVSLFGQDPRAHHLVNLFWHALNSALLFLLLRGMSEAPWRSFLAAALFVVHPLHVESVAWVSERKDVLSSFFALAAAAAWLRYARRPSWPRYLAVFLLLGLGLLAKPMLVTLPLLLLLLDWWPLGRLKAGAGRTSPGSLVLEKLPLAALAAASSALTLAAQIRGGALSGTDPRHFSWLVSNATVSYARYLGKTLWPVRLSMFYPFQDWTPWQTAGAAALLVAAGSAAWYLRRGRPWMLFGCAWFAMGLLPVIGLVRVGSQAMADRYMYLPIVGLFAAAAWGLHDLTRSRPAAKLAAVVVSAAVLAALVPLTRRQVGHWRSSETLFSRAMEIDPGNWLAANNMGVVLYRRGRYEEARRYFSLSVAGHRDAEHLTNLAASLSRLGRDADAVAAFAEALAMNPGYADAHYNLGIHLARSGRHEEAAGEFRRALESAPRHAEARNNLGASMWALGKGDEAIDHYRKSIESDPFNFNALNNLGLALRQKGLSAEAEESFRKALELKGDFAAAMVNLGDTLAGRKRGEEAAIWYRRALALRPNDPAVRSRLPMALSAP